eukprot:g6230.t1
MGSLFDNTTLSDEGIRSLIQRGLPSEYRLVAWKYLLRVGSNAKEFGRLVALGPHSAALASLSMRYPLRDQKSFRKTAVLLSALSHWSPILAEVEFAPSWCYPFIVVFSQDDLGAFEACLSFFLHWGSRLLVTFPQPPIPILAGMELSLARADPELAAHLASLEVGALSYGWPLLRTAFSEVLDREDWLRLIDRVLANAERPELLEAAAVGFAVASRAQLLALGSTREAEAFFRRRPASSVFDLERMFRVMERVSRFGPPEEWRGQDHSVGGREEDETSEAMAALGLLRSVPREFEPLPRIGAYPPYDGYPRFVVNYQVEELGRCAESIVSKEEALERAEKDVECNDREGYQF